MPLPITIFDGDRETLEHIFAKLDAMRPHLQDDLPADALGLYYWLHSTNTVTFLVGPDPRKPVAIFIVADIRPGDSAWGHVFALDHDGYQYRDLVDAAKAVCAVVMPQFGLWRLSGLTPESNIKALAFLTAVGFKREGHPRDAVSIGGVREGAILSGMTREDLRAALGPPPDSNIPESAILSVAPTT